MRDTMIIGKPVFRIQRTRNAHTSPPESEFYTVSTCRTLKGVRRRWRQLRQDQRLGGPNSWRFNLRILVACDPTDQSEIRWAMESHDLLPYSITLKEEPS